MLNPSRVAVLRTCCALLVLLAPISAAVAARQPAVLHVDGACRLALADGEQVALSLPDGVEPASAASLAGHGWVVAATNTATGHAAEMLLLVNDGQTTRSLAAPPIGSPGSPGAVALRREPLPLVDDGRLAGLAWLEGSGARSLAVRYARFDGSGWETPQTVAAPGPGSQLALTAARLGDGSWLLAWSAFDGHDDEILWSRSSLGSDTGWSPPQRVAADNDVPDITPALTATADGALLAWSTFDGLGYRLMTARFRQGRWSAPAAAAPSGSLFPSFEALDDKTTVLLYQTAAPRGWAVAEVAAGGELGRRATLAPSRNARPLLDATPDGAGVVFRWPAAAEAGTAGAAGAERRVEWERR